MLFPHRCSWACEQLCPGKVISLPERMLSKHADGRSSTRVGGRDIAAWVPTASGYRVPSPGCWQQVKGNVNAWLGAARVNAQQSQSSVEVRRVQHSHLADTDEPAVGAGCR